MNNNDDILLKKFFDENKHEIEDFGFSRRVMHHLPGIEQRIAKWWNYGMTMLTLLIFTLLDGWQLLWDMLIATLKVVIANGMASDINPLSFIVVAGVLLFLYFRNVLSLD